MTSPRIAPSPAQISKTISSASMTTLATFTDYRSAVALVDRMSDDSFPVESVRIVGTNLSTVEQVTGRLTRGKAARYGLGGGAWFGLFIGLMFSFFTPLLFWWPLLSSVVLGALFGASFGFLGHLATGGLRDFSAIQSFVVDSYEVQVDELHAASAQKYMISSS